MWNLLLKLAAKRLFPNTPFESLSRAQLQKITSEATKVMNRTKGQTAEIKDLPRGGIDNVPVNRQFTRGNLENFMDEMLSGHPRRSRQVFEVLDDDAYRGLQADTFRRLIANTDDDVKAFGKRIIENKQDVKFEKLTKDQRKGILDMVDDRIKMGNRKFMEKYDPKFPPEDFASGGIARVGFKNGKGVDLDRRMILKGMGALAALPVVGKFFKWAKPLAKRDIRVKMKPDMDYSWEGPESGWEGGSWLNLDFIPLTKKGTKILDDLAKNKKIGKSTHGKETSYYTAGNSEDGLMAVEDIKKMKGNMELETSVHNKVKGSVKGEYDTTKVYSGKDIDSKKILRESSDLATDSPYHDNVFQDEFTEEIINTIKKEKMASGGIAGELHLNRPGYKSGLLVKLRKLLKGKKKPKEDVVKPFEFPDELEMEKWKKEALENMQKSEMRLYEFDSKGKPHAEGGIAGQLHLHRPGYKSGKNVDLSALESLKGLKRSDGITGVEGRSRPQAGKAGSGLEEAQSEYIAKFFSGLSLLDKEKQNYAYKILENKIGSVALDLQTKQTGVETTGVEKLKEKFKIKENIPTRLDENTLYDILTTIKLPGNLKSEIMTTGSMSGVENYKIGLMDANNKLGIQYDDNTGTIVANYRVDVGSGSVTPVITKTGENIQTSTTATFPLSFIESGEGPAKHYTSLEVEKVPVRIGNETVMVPKKSISSQIQTDKERDLSDIDITYSDIGESLLKGSYREDDYDKSLNVSGFKKLPKNIELFGSFDKNLETGLDQSTAGINIPIGEHINFDLSKTQGDYQDDESARLNIGKTWETSVGDVSTQGWVDDEGEWHAGVLWSTQFGEKEKPPKVYEGTSISELDKVLKRKKLYAKGGLAQFSRPGYFRGALADTKEGKAMSPGTRADYSPGQGHRENVGRPPGGGDPRMTYTAPVVTKLQEKKVPVDFNPWTQNPKREKYLNILRRHDPKKFKEYADNLWDKNYISGFTEEEENLLEPYAREHISQFYHDLYRENPAAFLNRPDKPGVAPVKDPTLYVQPREYDWVAKGGRVGMGKGGLAKILGV